MKSEDIFSIIKIAGSIYAAQKVGKMLGFIKGKDELKGEDATAEVLTGAGKLGKAFNINYWNEVKNNVSMEKQNIIAASSPIKAQRYINSIGQLSNAFDDQEEVIEITTESIKSVFEFSYVMYLMVTPLQYVYGGSYTPLQYFESFLDYEELQIYIYKYITEMPLLPE